MKQYVLDEPMVAVPPPPVERQTLWLLPPSWWRWLVLALLIEAIALAVLYVALNGMPGARRAEPSPGIAYVASFSFPREPDAAPAPAPAQPTEAPVSRIRQEPGHYVVDLHDEAPSTALAMLADATKARVAGSAIFSGSALRLTRSVVATSPREAWQAVFGDVANFAIACAGSACEVRFVSLVKPGAPVPRPESLQGELSQVAPARAPALAPRAQAPVNQAAAAAQPIPNGNGVPVEN